jgi:hypothetical protein
MSVAQVDDRRARISKKSQECYLLFSLLVTQIGGSHILIYHGNGS